MSNGLGGVIFGSVAVVGMAMVLYGSIYIVDEGKIGVLTNMGRAVQQENPAGLQFKTPFVEGVREFDVRERAIPLQLSGATSNQLATTMDITVNWRPDPERIMEIFVKYGSPEDFASNILRPRLAQSAKSTVGKFNSVQLTRERNAVAAAIYEDVIKIIGDYPAMISSVQIENFTLPDVYWNAVLDREKQRELTEKEKLQLEQQAIQAQQKVQTAEADRDATIATADGEAYKRLAEAEADAKATELRGAAEANAAKAMASAIAANPLLVEYERVKSWNGQLPSTVLGDSPQLMMQMPQ